MQKLLQRVHAARFGHVAAVATRADVSQGLIVTRQRPSVGGQVNRALIREHPHQLLAGHARPHADMAGVQMHERRARGRIEADAAALQMHADGADPVERHARDVEVHGVAEHMLAELGDAGGLPPQHRVGLGRAIAAHDPDRFLGAGFALHLPHQVDEVRVHLGFLLLAPVAQEPIDLFQRRVVEAALTLEGDGDVFAGVHVVHGDRAGIALGDRVLQGTPAGQNDKSRKTARSGGALDDYRTASQPRLIKEHWRPRVDQLPTRSVTTSPRGRTTLNATLIWVGLTRCYGHPHPRHCHR